MWVRCVLCTRFLRPVVALAPGAAAAAAAAAGCAGAAAGAAPGAGAVNGCGTSPPVPGGAKGVAARRRAGIANLPSATKTSPCGPDTRRRKRPVSCSRAARRPGRRSARLRTRGGGRGVGAASAPWRAQARSTLVMTTLPEPGECRAHLAARALTSTLGLPASSKLAAGETTQSPAGTAADRLRARPPCATRPAATRRASMMHTRLALRLSCPSNAPCRCSRTVTLFAPRSVRLERSRSMGGCAVVRVVLRGSDQGARGGARRQG